MCLCASLRGSGSDTALCLGPYTKQCTTRGMLKQNDAETNSFSSSFKYSSLPESVPFQVLENGDIFSRKKIDYEKDPHW